MTVSCLRKQDPASDLVTLSAALCNSNTAHVYVLVHHILKITRVIYLFIYLHMFMCPFARQNEGREYCRGQ